MFSQLSSSGAIAGRGGRSWAGGLPRSMRCCVAALLSSLAARAQRYGFDDLDAVPDDVREGRRPAAELPPPSRQVLSVLTQAQLDGTGDE